MSGQPDLQTQKPYALDRLMALQGHILQTAQGMVLQRARIEKLRQTDLAAARDTYNELQRTRNELMDDLAESQLFLMEMEEYRQAVAAGIKVTPIEGGNKVEIIDAEGTKVINIMNGTNGKDGTDGKDGQDGVGGSTGVSETEVLELINQQLGVIENGTY